MTWAHPAPWLMFLAAGRGSQVAGSIAQVAKPHQYRLLAWAVTMPEKRWSWQQPVGAPDPGGRCRKQHWPRSVGSPGVCRSRQWQVWNPSSWCLVTSLVSGSESSSRQSGWLQLMGSLPGGAFCLRSCTRDHVSPHLRPLVLACLAACNEGGPGYRWNGSEDMALLPGAAVLHPCMHASGSLRWVQQLRENSACWMCRHGAARDYWAVPGTSKAIRVRGMLHFCSTRCCLVAEAGLI